MKFWLFRIGHIFSLKIVVFRMLDIILNAKVVATQQTWNMLWVFFFNTSWWSEIFFIDVMILRSIEKLHKFTLFPLWTHSKLWNCASVINILFVGWSMIGSVKLKYFFQIFVQQSVYFKSKNNCIWDWNLWLGLAENKDLKSDGGCFTRLNNLEWIL